MEVDTLTYVDIVEIIKRRKWSLIVPVSLLGFISIIIAFLLPSVYMSSAKILIEEQEIPNEYVKATVTSFAEQRVQSINQRIMSSARLIDIINRLNLYPELKEKKPEEHIVAKMRKDIDIKNIDVHLVDRRTGRSAAATIGFALSYKNSNPEKAQQVTNLLASMFLEENIRIRERQTSETTEFLEKEMGKIEKELDSVEGHITTFKENYINELPSLLQLNIQSLQGIESKKDMLNEELLAKKEQFEYLQSQLLSMPEASNELSDKRNLERLEALYVNLKSQYTDAYPDVVKVKDEIADLKQKIAFNPETGDSNNFLDNPAFVNLNAQISRISASINSLKRQIVEYEQKEDEYRKRIETSVSVEEEYRALVIKRDNTQAKHNDLMRKLMEAKVSYGLEEEQKSEKFILLEPANYPEIPFKPNRKMIVVLGFFAGFGLGSGLMAFREHFDQSIHNADMLAIATKYPVLGFIPIIDNRSDIARKRRKKVVIFVALLLIIVLGASSINYYFPFAVDLLMEKQ